MDEPQIKLIYVGNDHYQTIEKIEASPYGSDYWACYIPRVIAKELGINPIEHKLYVLTIKEAHNG